MAVTEQCERPDFHSSALVTQGNGTVGNKCESIWVMGHPSSWQPTLKWFRSENFSVLDLQ